MPIGEFCNREVAVVEPGSTVLEAAQLTRQHHVGSLVVVESLAATRKPVGIVTDRELVIEVLAKEVAPASLTVGDLLVGEAATVRTDAGLFDTLHYMREHGHRRMPVVDDHASSASPGIHAGVSETEPEPGAARLRSNSWRGSPGLQAGATHSGQLAGIVTLDGHIALFAEELTELTRLMATEQLREEERRP